MTKQLITSLVVASALLGMSVNLYALDLPKMGGGKKEQAPAGSADASSMQEGIVRQYDAASAELMTAQSRLFTAFGLKDEAAKLETAAKALQSGNVSNGDGVKKTVQMTKDADLKIKEEMKKTSALTDEGRKHYATAFLPYAKGVVATNKILPELKKFSEAATSQVKNAGLMDAPKLQSKLSAGMYLVSNLPGHASLLASTSKDMLTYAKNNNIEVPKDASDMLKF